VRDSSIAKLSNFRVSFARKIQRRGRKRSLVVDTSLLYSFSEVHIKYSIWLGGVPSFAGWVLSYDKPILLVLEEKEQLETH
jgi:hypothetical protein